MSIKYNKLCSSNIIKRKYFLRLFDSPSKQSVDALIEKENIHVNMIKQGVCVLVKMSNSKQDYIYLGNALSAIDDGEVKIMFFNSMDYTANQI